MSTCSVLFPTQIEAAQRGRRTSCAAYRHPLSVLLLESGPESKPRPGAMLLSSSFWWKIVVFATQEEGQGGSGKQPIRVGARGGASARKLLHWPEVHVSVLGVLEGDRLTTPPPRPPAASSAAKRAWTGQRREEGGDAGWKAQPAVFLIGPRAPLSCTH